MIYSVNVLNNNEAPFDVILFEQKLFKFKKTKIILFPNQQNKNKKLNLLKNFNFIK